VRVLVRRWHSRRGEFGKSKAGSSGFPHDFDAGIFLRCLLWAASCTIAREDANQAQRRITGALKTGAAGKTKSYEAPTSNHGRPFFPEKRTLRVSNFRNSQAERFFGNIAKLLEEGSVLRNEYAP